MNDFDPKHIHNASLYLQKKLNACKKRKKPADAVEKKKESFLRYLINLLFKP